VEAFTKPSSKSSILLAVILILFGVLAVALPIATSIQVARILAWLVILTGLVQFIYAFRSEAVRRIIWNVLVSILYVAAGAYLLMRPFIGLAGLTFVIVLFFVAEGVMDLSAYIMMRQSKGSRWLLVHGLIALILAGMLWRHWPFDSFWAIGMFVGISMLLSGTTRLAMAVGVRKAAQLA
jgi:uncharacterized membrane protein HdeD (DUF308 family)